MQWFSVLFLFLFSVSATEKVDTDLPVNAAGKISFADSVVVEALEKEALIRNALSYIARVKTAGDQTAKPQLDLSKGLLSKQGSFVVYKKGMLTPQPHGEIQYKVEIRIADGAYAYEYTDFVFQHYQRNRYGRYEAVSGKKKALEEGRFAGMQELWQEHKKTTRHHIENHIRTLAAKMRQETPGAHADESEEVQRN